MTSHLRPWYVVSQNIGSNDDEAFCNVMIPNPCFHLPGPNPPVVHSDAEVSKTIVAAAAFVGDQAFMHISTSYPGGL